MRARRCGRSGDFAFTLVELLVVISIIAVLAGLAFPAISGAIERTRKVQAKNDLVQSVTAVNAYYTEYGKYPLPGAATTTPDDYWITDGLIANLFNVLRASGLGWDSSTGENLNPRRVVFIQVPFAKNAARPLNGICPTGSNAGKYYDPWGNTYRLRIDWDYDNRLVNPYSAGAGGNPISLGSIAYSIGKDQASDADRNTGQYRTSGQNGNDDVLSWQ